MMEHKGLAPIEAIDLWTGRLKLRPNARTICYFIVEKIDNKDEIRKIAMELILSGCREFHFFGRQEPLWHMIFDEVDIDINPNSTAEDVALTMGYSTLKEFQEELVEGASVRAFVPQRIVLLYDNIEKYMELQKITQ